MEQWALVTKGSSGVQQDVAEPTVGSAGMGANRHSALLFPMQIVNQLDGFDARGNIKASAACLRACLRLGLLLLGVLAM